MPIAQPMSFGASEPATIRRIDGADLRAALAEGWRDFREMRGDILVVGLVYPLVGLFVAALALNGQFVPLAFPLCAGLSLLGPVVAIGFYELARRREDGEDSGWSHFFDGFVRRHDASVAGATILLMAIFLGWLGAAWGLFTATFGTGTFYTWSVDHGQMITLQAFIARLFTTGDGWTLMILGNLMGAGFAVVALAVSLVTFPMLIDRPVDVVTAVSTSLRAFAANWRILLRWGVTVAALLVLGAIPLFIGLAVVLPVLGYATWHLYRRLIV
jgi:uncharacterized membrane protein